MITLPGMQLEPMADSPRAGNTTGAPLPTAARVPLKFPRTPY